MKPGDYTVKERITADGRTVENIPLPWRERLPSWTLLWRLETGCGAADMVLLPMVKWSMRSIPASWETSRTGAASWGLAPTATPHP